MSSPVTARKSHRKQLQAQHLLQNMPGTRIGDQPPRCCHLEQHSIEVDTKTTRERRFNPVNLTVLGCGHGFPGMSCVRLDLEDSSRAATDWHSC